jgi:hypothetical protein
MFLLLLGGCIIVDGTTTGGGLTGGSGGVGNIDKTTSSTSGTSSTGMGGTGGSAGAGVGGSGAGCVKPQDGILDKNACAALNTQATGNVCGPMNNEAPLANGTCLRGFEIYQAGAADLLAKCLQTIEGDATNACDDAQVAKCVELMYKQACPSTDSATTCELIGNNLCVNGEKFDSQGCLLDTNPLNGAALQELADCISDPNSNPDCNIAYTDCFNLVRSFTP